MKLIIQDSRDQREFIFAQESWSVELLKNEIKKKYNITGDIELVYNGNILEDTDSLLAKDIKDGKTINFLGRFDAGKIII